MAARTGAGKGGAGGLTALAAFAELEENNDPDRLSNALAATISRGAVGHNGELPSKAGVALPPKREMMSSVRPISLNAVCVDGPGAAYALIAAAGVATRGVSIKSCEVLA
jgi:hypothetical protein